MARAERADNLTRYRAVCCGLDGTNTSATNPDGRCESRQSWDCVERECREEYLREFVLPFEANSAEPGRCKPCDTNATACEETFLTTRRVPLTEGHWRSNELGTRFLTCFPRQACQPTSADRPTLAETICADGHWGPLCSLCYDAYFKDAAGMCQPCAEMGAQLFIRLFWPLVFGLGLCGLCVMWLVQRLARKRWDLFVLQARRLKTYLRKVFGKISLRAMQVVAVPKIKVLVSMVQVQIGVSNAFFDKFPEQFMAFLNWFKALNLVDLPFDCIGHLQYRQELLLYTGVPLLGLCASYTAARMLPSYQENIVDFTFHLMFLMYPGVSSIIFSAFACKDFEDGTQFLQADLSVNCDTREHKITQAIAAVMIALIPVGVPLLYRYVTRVLYANHLDAVGRLHQYLIHGDDYVGGHERRRMAEMPSLDQDKEENARCERRANASKRLEVAIANWSARVRAALTQEDKGKEIIGCRADGGGAHVHTLVLKTSATTEGRLEERQVVWEDTHAPVGDLKGTIVEVEPKYGGRVELRVGSPAESRVILNPANALPSVPTSVPASGDADGGAAAAGDEPLSSEQRGDGGRRKANTTTHQTELLRNILEARRVHAMLTDEHVEVVNEGLRLLRGDLWSPRQGPHWCEGGARQQAGRCRGRGAFGCARRELRAGSPRGQWAQWQARRPAWQAAARRDRIRGGVSRVEAGRGDPAHHGGARRGDPKVCRVAPLLGDRARSDEGGAHRAPAVAGALLAPRAFGARGGGGLPQLPGEAARAARSTMAIRCPRPTVTSSY